MAALTAPRTYAPAKIQLELPNQPCALAWVGDALVAATYDYVEAEGARVGGLCLLRNAANVPVVAATFRTRRVGRGEAVHSRPCNIDARDELGAGVRVLQNQAVVERRLIVVRVDGAAGSDVPVGTSPTCMSVLHLRSCRWVEGNKPLGTMLTRDAANPCRRRRRASRRGG